MNSPWSREDDTADRMESVVSAYKLDTAERLRLLEGSVAQVSRFLRDIASEGAHLTADECIHLADLLDAATTEEA
jgi:hypothetical protein